MRTRDAVLTFQEVMSSDKSTKTIDLDIVDPISALGFEFKATNGDTSNQNNPLPFAITKIEVVDGSDVLCSMSFRQAQAMQFYKTGSTPHLREDEGPDAAQCIGCMILFGRHLWDPEYALDLTKYANPQLRITWDLTNIRACSDNTAWVSGTFQISAWAKVMEDLPGPGKFLMAKEIEAWTGGAAGDFRHQMPVDYTYRMLMFLCHNSFAGVEISIVNAKLTCDTDKFIPFDREVYELGEEMADQFGRAKVWKRYFCAHDDIIWTPIFGEPQAKFISTTLHHTTQYSSCWTGNIRIHMSDGSGGAVMADERLDGEVCGHGLHCSMPIPLGVMREPETWFDPTIYKKLELILSERSATNNTLVAEQVRPN